MCTLFHSVIRQEASFVRKFQTTVLSASQKKRRRRRMRKNVVRGYTVYYDVNGSVIPRDQAAANKRLN